MPATDPLMQSCLSAYQGCLSQQQLLSDYKDP